MRLRPIEQRLPDGRVWLRVADAEWDDPLDPSCARERGGRWNSPASFDTLYVCVDLRTARDQVHRLLEGSPVSEEDLADDAPFLLIVTRLPKRQVVADLRSDEGLRAVRLPATYPRKRSGARVSPQSCAKIGLAVHERGLRGILCRSALRADGSGRELAWFPATRASRATRQHTHSYAAWRHATTWSDLDLPDPRPLG